MRSFPLFSSADNGFRLAEIYGQEAVLSPGDRNAFSCLGYVTSYSVVIKYRPFAGPGRAGGGGFQSDLQPRRAAPVGWAGDGAGQPHTKEMKEGGGRLN